MVRGALERAAKEVEECTFAPKTTECPAYISVRERKNNNLSRKKMIIFVWLFLVHSFGYVTSV